MQDIAKLSQRPYGEQIITSKGVYRIFNDWVASVDDSTSNGLEIFGGNGWQPSDDDLNAIMAADKKASENGEYTVFYAEDIDKGVRIHNKTGNKEITNSLGGWFQSMGNNNLPTGDGTMLNYDPFGTSEVGSMPLSLLTFPASSYHVFHTINGELYELYFDNSVANNVCSIRKRTLLPDGVSFTESPSVNVISDFQSSQYYGIVMDVKDGSDRIAVLSYDGSSDVHFSILDFDSGIPTTCSNVIISADTILSFGLDVNRNTRITRINENHFLVFGRGTVVSTMEGVIIKVTAGVPSIVGTKTNLGAESIMRIQKLINISATESIVFYRQDITNPYATKTMKLSHNIVTGSITATVTDHGNKYKARDMLMLPSGNILHVYKPNTTAVYAEIFDPASPSDMFNGFQLPMASNGSSWLKISPISDDGYVFVFFENGVTAIKLKIPDTGTSLESLTEINGVSGVVRQQTIERDQDSFKLPTGQVVMHSYENSLRSLRIMNL